MVRECCARSPTRTYPGHLHTYSYGAAGAHVPLDPRTGHVQLVDYLSVEDIGRIINPLTANGQAVGAVVQGLGGVFLEHLQYDENGQLLTGSLADYLLPLASDFPNIRAIITGRSEERRVGKECRAGSAGENY